MFLAHIKFDLKFGRFLHRRHRQVWFDPLLDFNDPGLTFTQTLLCTACDGVPRCPPFPGTTRSFVVGSCSHSLTRGLSDHPLSEKLLLYGVRVARKFHTLTAHQRTQVPDFNGVDHCWAFSEERLTPSLGVTVCCLTGINPQLSTGYPCKEQLSEVVWATATTCRKSWSCRTFKMAKITDFFLKHLLELDLMTLGGALMKVPQLPKSRRGNVVVSISLMKLLLQITSLTKAPVCFTPVSHNKGTTVRLFCIHLSSLSSTMSARLAQHIRPPAPQYSIWAIDYETSYDEVEGLWGTISEADLLPFTLGQPTCRARGTPSNWLNKDGGALFVRSRGTAQMFFVHPCLLVPLVRSDDVHGLAP